MDLNGKFDNCINQSTTKNSDINTLEFLLLAS